MKPFITIFFSFFVLQCFGQDPLYQTWISSKLDYLELGPSQSMAGYSTLKKYKTKRNGNSLLLKSRHEKMRFAILKCNKDSLILSLRKERNSLFVDNTDTVRFVSKAKLYNYALSFKMLELGTGYYYFKIDSEGVIKLTIKRGDTTFTGNYIGKLDKAQFEKINDFIRNTDITRLPDQLIEPFDSEVFWLDVYFLHSSYNVLLSKNTFGTDPPYVYKEFIDFIKNLPKNIQLRKSD